MRLSYLIATYNRKDVLRRHLNILMDQTYPGPFEVIVCDDGSTDGTHEMLQELCKETYLAPKSREKGDKKYSLRWLNTGNSTVNTVARSKNNGIRAAKGQVVILVDDDNLPHKRMIEQYLAKFNPQQVQLGYKSRLEEYLTRELPVSIEPGLMSIWHSDDVEGRFGHFQCGSVCMSIEAARTTAKDGSLGFDERFTGYGHEDTEFGQRLYQAGYILMFNRDAIVWHMDKESAPQQDEDFKEAERERTARLLEKICREPWPTMANVYPGFINTTGMMTPGELRWLYNTASRMNSIVEIGCFAGRSAHALLSGCDGPVYCIDPWDAIFIGSPENAENIRRSFMENTAIFINRKVIELPSMMAAKGFADKAVDMVFIDADHAYGSVKQDIEAWLPKAAKMICGHDYCPTFPGVIQAVKEFFGDNIGICETIWFAVLEAK